MAIVDMNDIMDDEYELIEVCDAKCLFTNSRLPYPNENPFTLNGMTLYRYDARHTDDTEYPICEIANHIIVNHGGTIISAVPLIDDDATSRLINPEEDINFLGGTTSLSEGFKEISK